MAERYESQVNEVALPGVRVQNHIDGAAAGVQVAEAMGGMARPLQNLGVVLQEKQDEFDRTRALELYNQYQKDVSEFHFNPDTGAYATYKGSKAGSLYNDADKFMIDMAQKYEGEIKNPKVLNAFKGMVQSLQLRQNESNMKVQFKEIENYKAEQSTATIKLGLTEIGRNYDNDAAVESIRSEMDMALWNQYGTASPEVQRLAQGKMDNDIAIARISPMIKQDQMAAKGWFDAHRKEFLPEVAEKVDGIIGGEVEKRVVTSAVNAIWDNVGPEKMAVASDQVFSEIRKKYPPEIAESIISDLKRRREEYTVADGRRESESKKAQDAYFDQTYGIQYAAGYGVDSSKLQEDYKAGRINNDQFIKGLNWLNKAAKTADTEKRLKKDPKYLALPPAQQEIVLMREMGITDDVHTYAFNNALNGIQDGSVDNKRIDQMLKDHVITTAEAGRIKSAIASMNDMQKNYQKSQLDDMNKALNDLKVNGVDTQKVAYEFNQRVLSLDPKDSGWRKAVFEAKEGVLLEFITGLSDNKKITPLLKVIEEKVSKEDFTGPERPMLDRSKVRMDTLNLNAGAHDGSGTGGAFWSAQITGTPISVGEGQAYGAPRTYRNGTHESVDYSMPVGTPLRPLNVGVPLEVLRVDATGKGNGGKTVVMGGTLANGDKIEVSYRHLDSISVRKGDRVTQGQVIAKSGNTGVSSGPHLDLGFKVNGKSVDPEKWRPPVYAELSNIQDGVPSLDALRGGRGVDLSGNSGRRGYDSVSGTQR